MIAEPARDPGSTGSSRLPPRACVRAPAGMFGGAPLRPQSTQHAELRNQVPWAVCAFSGRGARDRRVSCRGVCLPGKGCAPISTWVMVYV